MVEVNSMLWFGLLILIWFLLNSKVKSMIPNFDYQKYVELIKEAESGGDYTIENSIGALGAYQFMPTTLNYLRDTFQLPEWKPKQDFLNNPGLQDQYFKIFVEDNHKALIASGSNEFVGEVVMGSKNPKYKDFISPANYYGLLAGSHLGGVGGVMKYFLQGVNKDDGKTSISDYIAYFSFKGNEVA